VTGCNIFLNGVSFIYLSSVSVPQPSGCPWVRGNSPADPEGRPAEVTAESGFGARGGPLASATSLAWQPVLGGLGACASAVLQWAAACFVLLFLSGVRWPEPRQAAETDVEMGVFALSVLQTHQLGYLGVFPVDN